MFRTRHAGEIAINTTYGNVEAVLLDLRWSQDGYFETLTGAVEVHVANNANLDIAMETGGNLTTDYTITVESDEETSVKECPVKVRQWRQDPDPQEHDRGYFVV